MDIKTDIANNGILVLDNFFSEMDLRSIQVEMRELILSFESIMGLAPSQTFNTLDERFVHLLNKFPHVQPFLYDRLQLMPSLLALPSNLKVMQVAESLLETTHIGVWPRVQLRMDLFNDDYNVIGWHTDYIYNKGTRDSYTFWAPLVPVVADMGGLLFAKKSHLRDDIQFIKSSESRRFEYTLSEETLNSLDISSSGVFNLGDLVIFHSQYIHAGTANQNSNRARMTALFRMQNLNTLEVFPAE